MTGNKQIDTATMPDLMACLTCLFPRLPPIMWPGSAMRCEPLGRKCGRRFVSHLKISLSYWQTATVVSPSNASNCRDGSLPPAYRPHSIDSFGARGPIFVCEDRSVPLIVEHLLVQRATTTGPFFTPGPEWGRKLPPWPDTGVRFHFLLSIPHFNSQGGT